MKDGFKKKSYASLPQTMLKATPGKRLQEEQCLR